MCAPTFEKYLKHSWIKYFTSARSGHADLLQRILSLTSGSIYFISKRVAWVQNSLMLSSTELDVLLFTFPIVRMIFISFFLRLISSCFFSLFRFNCSCIVFFQSAILSSSLLCQRKRFLGCSLACTAAAYGWIALLTMSSPAPRIISSCFLSYSFFLLLIFYSTLLSQ